jgi:hypothetical protein
LSSLHIPVSLMLFSLASGCYVNTKLPLDRDLDRTVLGAKVGRASTQGFLWAVAVGDSGIQAAAKNGGIQTIQHADQEYFVVLGGAYVRLTTIVYGD